MSHWLILLGFLTLAARLTNGMQEDKAENSKMVAPSNDKLQICGMRIRAEINAICGPGTTYRPHSRKRREVIPRRQIRQVVDKCCRRGCKYSDLQRYCGTPTPREEPRSVSLQEFLQELADFFHQTSSQRASRLPAKPLVEIREDLPEVLYDEPEEELNSSDDVRRRRARRKQHTLYSDESPQEALEEELRLAHHSTPGHLVTSEYKPRPALTSGMEKLALENGAGIAVIIPDRI